MNTNTLFRDRVGLLALRLECLLAGIREGDSATGVDVSVVTMAIGESAMSANELASINAIRREVEGETWDKVAGLDYDELLDFNVPDLYISNLYTAIKEEMEDVLGEDGGWRIGVPYICQDSGIRIDGHLILNQNDWTAHLIETSGFDGFVSTLSLISEHQAFNGEHPLIQRLRNEGVMAVIRDNLLTAEQIEALELDLKTDRLPYQLQLTLSAAYLVKILIEANLNTEYEMHNVLISNNGLMITMGHSFRSISPSTPKHRRQIFDFDIDDIEAITELVA